MSQNRFVFEGLDELREALRRLPDDLTGEASHIIEAAKNGAEADIKSQYPAGPLRDHLTSSIERTGFSVVAIIKNTAKTIQGIDLASLYEFGSQARHTVIGADRGTMPARPVFVPVMVRKRRQMYENFRDLLTRYGLLVTGDATR
jgi:hypothetical protein